MNTALITVGKGSVNSPRVVLLPDGRLRVYANANGPTGEGIFSALSTDGGLRFVREPGIRLARETKWERFGSFSPEPLMIGDGSAVRMFYAGVPNKDA